MSLHPQIVAVIEALNAAGLPPLEALSPAAARDQVIAMGEARGPFGPEAGAIRNRVVPGPGGGIPCRIYRPTGAVEGQSPGLVYFHGGGHVVGNLNTHDSVARSLCEEAGVTVCSVNYRKGPEHKFPAAVEDCFAVTKWCAENGGEIGMDGSRIAVGGDSAGGNLAAVVALMARDAGGPALRHQLLVYPVADYSCVSPSYEAFGEGYGPLTDGLMRWFQVHYLNDAAEAEDWRASPLKASDLQELPPALVITAEYDVLHNDGVAYAEALRKAGNAVTHTDYAGMIHMFFAMPPAIDGAVAARTEAANALREALA